MKPRRCENRRRLWPAVGVVLALLGVMAVAALWLARGAGPEVGPTANTLGSASAPVTVEEWGDFQ